LPDESILRARLWRFVIAVSVLTGVAALKILIALQRGRTNIFFLILLAVFFVLVALRVHNPLRTRRGDALLADLRNLFSSLKARARMLRPGGETADAALLMAVFGLAALPTAAFPYAKRFQPKSTALSTTSCGSACGSSCGSSCGGDGGCGGCGGS
jgi:uncharacterized protein (TIGR04222 family)